nr:low specificity L-threonine aldolase [uncultured Carboxylicivirga sp.]
MKHIRGFASDNNASVHPKIMEALVKANQGHAVGYGGDEITERTQKLFKKVFGDEVETFFVYNGTGANVVSIQAMTQSYNAVVCARTAHINVDECGAPEKISGCKLLPIETDNGKITVDQIKQYMHGFGFEHHAQPKLISITQVTELGTLYSIDEIKAIADYVHSLGLYLHMDGARLSNAAAALGCTLADTTFNAGVDVLSFGGTKNGLMYGEAVVFANAKLAENVKYIRKQSMQLHSKMRYTAAQFEAMLTDELWRECALHANKMAMKLEAGIKQLKNVQLTQAVDSNGIFAIVPEEAITKLQQEYFFYMWDENCSEVRWMTSFDTQEEDIDGFLELLKKEVG